jgi:hypothetical protein
MRSITSPVDRLLLDGLGRVDGTAAAWLRA